MSEIPEVYVWISEADLGPRKDPQEKEVIRFLVSLSHSNMLSNVIQFQNRVNADKIINEWQLTEIVKVTLSLSLSVCFNLYTIL